GCGKEPQDALGTLPAGDAIAARTDDLESPEPSTRKTAANALGAMGRPAEPAIPPLVEALNDDDAEVREAVAWALTRFAYDTKVAQFRHRLGLKYRNSRVIYTAVSRPKALV